MENLRPQVGDQVQVRQRRWRIQDVDEYPHARVVTLAGHEPDGVPCTMAVLHPADDVTPVGRRMSSRLAGMRRWRRACARLLIEHGGATALHSATSAAVDVLPFQLEPALALLDGRGARLLIADEVGLGKTVQALLCVAELRARSIVRRVLVLCPAGLREQWVAEADSRTQLPFVLMDHGALRHRAARVPADINPWTEEPLVVASTDFAKRPEILPAVAAAGWDLVIVDEAHGCCGDSERQQAVSMLAERAPFVVLLSATPHNGDEPAFAALCHLGRLGDDLLVFRRTRLEVGRDAGRRVHTIRITPTSPERRMHAALAAFSRAVRQERREVDRTAWLMLTLLHKRALSSPFALASSAERRLRWLDEEHPGAGAQLTLPWNDDTGELDADDAAPLMTQAPALADSRLERRLLQRVVDAAHDASGAEGKLARLRRLLHAVREPVIVFTEYRDTLQHLRGQLTQEAALMHGGMSREQRRAALEAFRTCGLLLATDAASEGLNLQGHCRVVVNLELPWNPMRLEQRIGRVDRIGQPHRVHVFHLIAGGTGETRLLSRLSARVSRAQARVGAPNPLGGRPEWTDEMSARLVVLREDPRQVSAPPMVPPHVAQTRLDAEARAEATRLSIARSLRSLAGPQLDPSLAPTLLRARSHRRHLRAALAARTLRLFRTRMLDASGRTIATHVAATLGSTPPRHPVLAAAEADAVGASDSYCLWATHSRDAHQRFTALRLRRAQAIARACATGHDEQQPGLFDRRTERAVHTHRAERLRARATAEARVAAVAASATVSVSDPELMLVLDVGPHA